MGNTAVEGKRNSTVRTIFAKIENSFLEYGWLMPAVLPIFEPLGRGVFNILLAFYIVWGLVPLLMGHISADRRLKLQISALLLAFSFGLFYAVDPGRAVKTWLSYSFLTLTIIFTLAGLRKDERSLAKLLTVLAVVGVIVPILLVAKTALLSGGRLWVPRRLLLERNMPFLFPFLAFAVVQRWRKKTALILLGLISAEYLVIILFSAGRSALLGFVVALIVYFSRLWRKEISYIFPAAIAIIVAVAVFAVNWNGVAFDRNARLSGSVFEEMDLVSSGRLKLWANAVNNPPPNLFVGVGMGNVRYADKVVENEDPTKKTSGRLTNSIHKVRHLHNFLLDCWYETGFIGVTLLLALMVPIILRALRSLLTFQGRPDNLMVVFSSIFALLVSGMLSFSYTSNQLTLYLFMLFGILIYLTDSPENQHQVWL